MYKLKPGQLQRGLYDITSSFALSASYAPNTNAFPYSGSAVITGSLTIKSDIDDIFLIKTFNGNNVFTISQSGIIVLATQSVELNNPAPNGGMYFTSGALFIGLDL